MDGVDSYSLGTPTRVEADAGLDRGEAPHGLEPSLGDLLQILGISNRPQHWTADLDLLRKNQGANGVWWERRLADEEDVTAIAGTEIPGLARRWQNRHAVKVNTPSRIDSHERRSAACDGHRRHQDSYRSGRDHPITPGVPSRTSSRPHRQTSSSFGPNRLSWTSRLGLPIPRTEPPRHRGGPERSAPQLRATHSRRPASSAARRAAPRSAA